MPGRRTYDMWSGNWPDAPSSPMADRLNAATKYVVTHRPECLEWGPFEAVGTDVVEGVRRIKAQDGPDLVVAGSSTLTSTLLGNGVADTFLAIVYPVLVRSGEAALRAGDPGADVRARPHRHDADRPDPRHVPGRRAAGDARFDRVLTRPAIRGRSRRVRRSRLARTVCPSRRRRPVSPPGSTYRGAMSDITGEAIAALAQRLDALVLSDEERAVLTEVFDRAVGGEVQGFGSRAPFGPGWGPRLGAVFPDVCKKPSPGSPVPIPYPNVG